MDWFSLVKYFIGISVSTLTIGAAMIYIIKLAINKTIDLGIENYKSTLQLQLETHKANLALESKKIESSYALLNFEHQIKFSKFYEERATVIKNLHNQLLTLEYKLLHMVTMAQGPEWSTSYDRDNEVIEVQKQLKETMELERIYLTEDLFNEIEWLCTAAREVVIKMNEAKIRETGINRKMSSHSQIDDMHRPLDIWIESNHRVTSELKAARLKLVEQFRGFIGINKPS